MNTKPLIKPAKLPCQVSYSGTSLIVKVREDYSDLEVSLSVGMLYNTISKECILPESKSNEDFDDISDSLVILGNFRTIMKPRGPYWLQVLPPYSDTLGLNPNEFDWSLVDVNFLPHRKYSTPDERDASRYRYKKVWYSTGNSPMPQIYQLMGSNWLSSISGISDDYRQKLTHYIICAHDHRVDIITEKLEFTVISTFEDMNIEIQGEITID